MPLQTLSPCDLKLRTAVIMASALALALIVFSARSPLSAPLPNVDLERQLLAGSDALLERMVIPPHRPDWVLMECSGDSSQASTYDRIRYALCEAAGKTRTTSSLF